jgi:predicted RNA-binding Zn-ribbon protein involved in translation (DUF1610 family)
MTITKKDTLLKSNQPRIISFDTETSPIITTTFSLYPESISHNNILQDWYIICASWKVLGEEKVFSVSCKKPTSDKEVCRKLRDALISADIIVAHNGKKFDVKKLNARLIYHKLEPLPQIPMVDTLVEVKKVAQFTSHRLDYLGKHLLGHGKLPTSEGLWLRALKGDKVAVKEMTDYCEVDVIRLEELYLRLRPYFKTHPHVGVITQGVKNDCPKCGSIRMSKSKIRISATGTKTQQLQCQDCGSYHTIPFKEIK